jgi:hypothetical protein
VIRLFLITALLFLSGCVHLEEAIEINADGSAKIVINYSMPIEGLTLLQDSEEVLQELNKEKVSGEMPRIFNNDAMRAHFKKFPGVNVISLRINQEDKRINTFLHLRVENLRKALRKGLFPYTSLEQDGDDYVFSALYPYNMKKLKKGNDMAKVAKDMQVSFKVKTPGAITSTNALRKESHLAEWNYSAKTTPFSECDGRFTVKFDASKLNFLDDSEE